MSDTKQPAGWVLSTVTGTVEDDGTIHLNSFDHVPQFSPKPSSSVESRVTDYDFNGISQRTSGVYKTNTHIGGAISMMVPLAALRMFGSEKWDQRLLGRVGEPNTRIVHVAAIRNAGAPAEQFVAAPFGGMATSTEFELEQLMEGIGECLVFQDDGWARVRLPDKLAHHQQRVDEELHHIWSIVRPDFPQKYEVDIALHDIGRDTLDGRSGVISCGPVGDLALLSFAALDLTPVGNWMLRDGELSGDRALNRPFVAMFERRGCSPLMFPCKREGGFDPNGMAVPISGDVVHESLSHLERAILGPRGLDWLN
ncbi:MAG: hypothetical protein WCO52_01385 [bacterium]